MLVLVACRRWGECQFVALKPVLEKSLILLVGNYSSEPASLSSKDTCFNLITQLVELFTLQFHGAWQNSLYCYAALHLLEQAELLSQLTKAKAKHVRVPRARVGPLT